MGLGFFFKYVPGIRRTLLFRFSLMVIRAGMPHAPVRPTVAWSSLKGERFVTLHPTLPLQRTRRSKPWLTMVDTRVEVSGFVRPRRWG